MGRRIVQRPGPVAGHAQNRAVAHHHRADRHLAERRGLTGGGEGEVERVGHQSPEAASRATSRLPMSLRKKPSGQSIRATAA